MRNGIVRDLWGAYYFKNNKLHREDGPAIEYRDGGEAWLIDDEFHRLDGPARIWNNGHQEWWIDGKHVPCHSQEEFERIVNLLAFG